MLQSTCVCCGGNVDIPGLDGIRDYTFGIDWKGTIQCCSTCGLGQLVPMMTAEQAVSYYPESYVHYHAAPTGLRGWLMRQYMKPVVRKLRALGVRPGQRLLDIGCGCGHKSAVLGQALGLEVVGIEPNSVACANARRTFGMEVHQGFFPHPAIAPASFDVVYINHVIEHLPDPVQLLKDISRTLKPGGWLIGETESIDCLSARLFGPYWSLIHAPFHLLFFTPKTLKEVFARSPFRDVDIITRTDPTVWSLSLQTYLRRKCSPEELKKRAPRMPGYLTLTILAKPISWLELGNGPILQFYAQKKVGHLAPAMRGIDARQGFTASMPGATSNDC